MSYSAKVKEELVRNPIMPQCCLKAQAYGLVLFGRTFSSRSVSFSTENSPTAMLYAESIRSITGSSPQIETGVNKKNTLKIRPAQDRANLLHYFGHSPNELSLRINRGNLADECCFGAFIRGVFLSCGTVSSPEKNYHLEFVVPHMKLCLDLIKLLDEVKLRPKNISRNGSNIVYFKDSENIEDILTIMGATDSSLELMGVKMQKNMRNKVNRKVNFEVANLSKTVEASRIQIEAINLIDSLRGLGSLSKHLLEVAVLRSNNPEISLNELGKMLENPISRSGINHRLKRIVEIAVRLEK